MRACPCFHKLITGYIEPNPDSRDDSIVDLLELYAFGPYISFSFWHEEGALITTSAHDSQKTEKLKKNINFLQVSQVEGLFVCPDFFKCRNWMLIVCASLKSSLVCQI